MENSSFTSKVQPSALLARLQAFLPEMKKANEDLQMKIETDGVETVSIENPGQDEPKIEMGVTLGVLEEQSATDGVSDGDLKLPRDDAQGKCVMNVKFRAGDEEEEIEHVITSAEELRALGYAPVGDVSVMTDFAATREEEESDESHQDSAEGKDGRKHPLIQVVDES